MTDAPDRQPAPFVCATCVFFSPNIVKNGDNGQCRRHAPALYVDEEGRRRYLRRSVLWPGTLKSGASQMDCTILNMSLGGAKVALSQERDCAGSVILFGDRFDGLEATVMWQRGRVVGLQFKVEPTEVARILGDLLPAIKASA